LCALGNEALDLLGGAEVKREGREDLEAADAEGNGVELALEGRCASHHLVEGHAEAPDVGGGIAGPAADDFRGHEGNGAAKVHGVVEPPEGAAGAKVGDLGLAVDQDDVVALEVEVHDVLGVDMGEACADVAEVRENLDLGKDPLIPCLPQGHTLLHHDVIVVLGLGHPEALDDV